MRRSRCIQNGDVDYLVATDAIGMGLNLDVDHVAFASDSKYDGYQFRRLNPSGIRPDRGPRRPRHARRHLRHHRPLRAVRERAGRCACRSMPSTTSRSCNGAIPRSISRRSARCRSTLAQTPNHEALTRAPVAEDIRVLDHAARDEDVRAMARGAHTRRAAVGGLPDPGLPPASRRPPMPSS